MSHAPRSETGAGPRTSRSLTTCAGAAGVARPLCGSDPGDYAELLGLYLGDGHISVLARAEQLRICLFPQHGPAKKHERPIVLEPWQETIVAAQSWAFLRGCIRSDGCVFINRTGRYEYLSYCFDNYSPDIRGLFIAACDRVGVVCRPSGTSVRIYRRASVALMAEHVGGKC